MRCFAFVLVVTLVVLSPAPVTAQEPRAAQRGMTLGALQQAAIAADPRAGQLVLLDTQSALRERNLLATRLPVFSFDAQTQYQSDVPMAPFLLPSGRPLFSPPHAMYDAFARIEQRLFDPLRQPQVAVERAQRAEAQARVRTALYAVRQQVSDAFFAAFALQEREHAVTAAIGSLDGRRAEVSARVDAGAALPAEAAALEATVLARQQEAEELRIDREAALTRLERLTRRRLDGTTDLVVPDADRVLADARGAANARLRPEHAQFAEIRGRLTRQADLVAAQQRPRVGAFVRAGYGRPGLNFIGDRFDVYGIVGVQFQWRPITWGTAERERESLRLQQQIVDADEAAFAKGLEDVVPSDILTLERLQRAAAADDRIVELREQIERSAQVRLQEGAITASDYIDRNVELMQARIARAGRRVDLARTAAHLFTLLGLEIP